MRRYGESQTAQDKVLYYCCHVTSALGTLSSEGHVITIAILLFRFIKNKVEILILFKKNLFKNNFMHNIRKNTYLEDLYSFEIYIS